jgi:hypothetical protein
MPADASTAVSSPADTSQILEQLSPKDLAHWRMTGDLPTSAPVREDVATSTDAASTPASPAEPDTSTDVKDPAASEPATSQTTKPKKNADTRIPELLSDRAREKDRADRLEAENRELRAKLPSETPPAESSPAPAAARPLAEFVNSPDLDQPLLDEDAFFARYSTAKIVDFNRYVFNHLQGVKTAQERQHGEVRGRYEAFGKRWAAAVDADPTFPDRLAPAVRQLETLDAAIAAGKPVTGRHLVAQEIYESPRVTDLLEHFSAHGDELEALARQSPMVIARAIGRLEARFETTAAQPEPTVPPKRGVSSAPTPTTDLGRRPATNADPVKSALADDDYGRYVEEMNRRDAARRG